MVTAITKGATTSKASPITVEEYLAQEEIREEKSEFIEGEIIKMAGASANHNRLAVNFSRLLPLEIDNQSYEIFVSDMRLLLPDGENYFYPDVMVIKGEPRFTNEKETAVTNPCLIAEILSNSTEGFDKNQKFAFYRTIPELKEYILIDQEDYRVELYRKVGKNQWLLTELMSQEDVLTLESVEVEISLADLYKRVKFTNK
ncbi:Uma2 family endonuclease [Cyanobacterium aponinum FACHB-4101]|uniref:Uma2 family endonuclease n=1 Tax=Cyanobacterium aponinum TaxID=379064 RepID=UPI001680D811|nr:Uma2 family endonuclease [Cyanobacterium aponinum]MBD2394368.1 Uma2 family endonuclease [Cyanobacterium aponinum FACHB-4101]